MAQFVELFGEVDALGLEEDVYAALEAQFEEWEAASGGLDTWLTKAFIRIAVTVFDLASIMSREAFKTFGETVVATPPILAAPATVKSTWKAIDAVGHIIPDGTVVTVTSGDVAYGFRTVGDVTIPAESEETEAGEVLLEAVEAGAEYNGLSGTAELSSSLSFINPGGITLVGETANGVDAEDEDTYLARLTEELQTLTLSAVVPRDYEILSRRVAGVARAVALDNYDAEEAKEGVPLVVSVAVVDAEGQELSEGVKEAVEALLEERSLTNVVTYVIDPTYTTISIKATVVVAPGYDSEAVLAAVEARLAEYLDPGQWGIPTTGTGDEGNTAGWINQTSVYRFELVSEIDRVAGVDRVVNVELAAGEAELGTADVEIEGPAPLAKPGTIEVLAE